MQHALIRLMGEWREKLDNDNFIGVVLRDLLEIFDLYLL